MKFFFDGVAISVGSRTSKDGKVYRSINIDQDGEIVTFECTEEVANFVEKYKPYQYVGSYVKGEFNGRVYSRIGVVAAQPQK